MTNSNLHELEVTLPGSRLSLRTTSFTQQLSLNFGPEVPMPTSTDSDKTSVTASTPTNTAISTTSVNAPGALTSPTRTEELPPQAGSTQTSSISPMTTSSINGQIISPKFNISMDTGTTSSSGPSSISLAMSADPSNTSMTPTHTKQHGTASVTEIATVALGVISATLALAFTIYWRRRKNRDTVCPLQNESRGNHVQRYTLATARRRQYARAQPYTVTSDLQPSLAFGTSFRWMKRLWVEKDLSTITGRHINANTQDSRPSLTNCTSRAAPIYENPYATFSHANRPTVNTLAAEVAELRSQVLYMQMRSTPAHNTRCPSVNAPPSYVSEMDELDG